MIYYIENDYLKVGIKQFGGTLTSIIDKKTNDEMLYQPLENSWQGQDVVIFPFVGRLKNKTYSVDGHEYSMESHGLIRYNECQLVNHENDSLTLSFSSNEETLKKYPFAFEFLINYKLVNNEIKVTYKVINNDNKNLIYGIGGHPAFIVDGVQLDEEFDIFGNMININKNGKINKVYLDEAGTFIDHIDEIDHNNQIMITKELMRKEKTIIFTGKNILSVLLKRKNGQTVELLTNSSDYLALWTDKNFGNYIAIEPWWSLPDFVNGSKELSIKPSLHKLNCNESKEYSYSILIN